MIENYRAVSLLPAFAKIYEKAFYRRLSTFFMENNLLSHSQFGFTKGVSTQDAIISTINSIIKALEDRCLVTGLFFDYTRAFEMVDHEILKNKIYAYGVRGQPWGWISSYLTNRSQRVTLKIEGTSYDSEIRNVERGVPQGSVLGPLLFLIFINDIVNNFDQIERITLFADDVSAVVTGRDTGELSHRASACSKDIQGYSDRNGLMLNLSKTESILFSYRTPDFNILINTGNKLIEQSQSAGFLGVRIDSQLSWNQQVDDVLKKMNTFCFVFWKLRSNVSRHILLSYYYANVNSVLSYGVVAWGGSRRSEEVFIAQKKIIRTMMFKNYNYSCRNLFKELNILTFFSVYILQCAIYVKKNIANYTTTAHVVDQHDLRGMDTLRLPAHRMTHSANSSYILPIKVFNHLPPHIRQIENVNLFKRNLKVILLDGSFYSLQEFFGKRLG